MRTVTVTSLLATASDVTGIQTMLNRFYYSTHWRVDPETLAISHPTKTGDGLRVILKRGRYRLETVRLESAAIIA